MLRRYFAWARQRKLILIDPARPLRPGAQPAFTGTVLDTATQRALLRRRTSPGTHPHERLAGLLTLLHAASSTQIRALTITGATRTSDAPADGSYLSGRLAPAGTTPSACRQTRIAQLVNDLDPKLTAAALGMRGSGLIRYLADNVARDRLHRLSPR